MRRSIGEKAINGVEKVLAIVLRISMTVSAVFFIGAIFFPAPRRDGNFTGSGIGVGDAGTYEKGRINKIRIQYIIKPDRQLRSDFWHYTLPVLGNEPCLGRRLCHMLLKAALFQYSFTADQSVGH